MNVSDPPRDLAREHRLHDGRTVTIRPIRADDVARIRRFLDATSEDSRYMRFQKWIRVPSDKLVHFLVDVDGVRHVALVCTAAEGAEEHIVGEARYIAEPGGQCCEFGVMIDDAWRRSGIAGLLMEALIRAARECGFATMEGFVLASNPEMMRFAHALGFVVEPVEEDLTLVRIVKRLQRASDPGAAA